MNGMAGERTGSSEVLLQMALVLAVLAGLANCVAALGGF